VPLRAFVMYKAHHTSNAETKSALALARLGEPLQ
jgi:hypothetical protein